MVIKPRTKMDEACGTCAGEETFLCSSGGASPRKGPLGKPWHRWEDNIKLHLTEMDWEGMD